MRDGKSTWLRRFWKTRPSRAESMRCVPVVAHCMAYCDGIPRRTHEPNATNLSSRKSHGLEFSSLGAQTENSLLYEQKPSFSALPVRHSYGHKFLMPQFGRISDSCGTRTILSPTLVSPKRQQGTTGQGIAVQIQDIGLVISLKTQSLAGASG